MRVYLPGTVPMLRSALANDAVNPLRGIVFAVTSALVLEYPDAELDELEYLAMHDAALASLRLIAADGDAGTAMRVVIAADVDEVTERPEWDRSAAEVVGPVPWRAVAAVHVDGADARPAVAAAAAVVDAADLGDDDAEFLLGEVDDIELAWFAPDEISYLLDGWESPLAD